jgi:quinolinate synthase
MKASESMDSVDVETIDDIFQRLKTRLRGVDPDPVLRYKAELAYEINRLKKEKNAIILGHNYMEPALYHSVTDIRGDSLELSRKAAAATQDIIVFCGVQFMAETAKILNPHKKVLIPSQKAGCSLAESITAEDVRLLRARFPGVPVVAYVNTYAEVKAEVDICCTSGNAVKVVQSLDAEKIIFLPDEYLAKNVAQETGKRIIIPRKVGNRLEIPEADGEFDFIGWQGRCEVHEKFQVSDIAAARAQFPQVLILAHPECSPEVVAAADFSGSTTAMIQKVQQSQAPYYLLLTECAMADNIAASNPGKEMLGLCSVRCPHMNTITLENTLESLQKEQYEVHVPEEIRLRAVRSVERMIAIG